MLYKYLLIPVLCFSSGVYAKVTYDDAIESNRPYTEANASVHNQWDDSGLSDAEQPDEGESGEFGTWAAFTGNPYYIESSMMFKGDPTGQQCSPKGSYGSQDYEDCTHVGNGDFDCDIRTKYYKCE
ncbi:conserved exported hypothetical protein [Vibrio jasicida]|uniref:hypothetical protein n=1 Tax=Vibrio jasicida TaxID=766224 RepID=UPI002893E30A|nr:conserved exported hypothetical protein [Vibrio jasicida]